MKVRVFARFLFAAIFLALGLAIGVAASGRVWCLLAGMAVGQVVALIVMLFCMGAKEQQS